MTNRKEFLGLIAFLMLFLFSSAFAHADQLGTASGQIIDCPTGISDGVCYQVAITCPNVPDINGYLDVITPDSPNGTVIMTTGGNGTNLYELDYTFGQLTVDDIAQAGYTTVQISWNAPFTTTQPKGWQKAKNGIRAAACRYATLAQWIYDNIHEGGPTAPLCATGNSAGGEQIGLALAHYGLGSIFAMVEPTSGPPFSRQDYSCECNQPNLPHPCTGQPTTQCVNPRNAYFYIDPAYPGPACTYSVLTHSTKYGNIFLHDSILSPDAVLNYPNTNVHFLWGSQDNTSAPVMGQEYQNAITSSVSSSCADGSGHNIPNTFAGAQQIANDMITMCHLPGKK